VGDQQLTDLANREQAEWLRTAVGPPRLVQLLPPKPPNDEPFFSFLVRLMIELIMPQPPLPWDPNADEPDPFLRPAWADFDIDEPPGPVRQPLPRSMQPAAATHDAAGLLAPLAAAAEALARLDAGAALLPEALQEGLVARLTYAEAAGWLAAQGVTAHPLTLALRDSERLGRRELFPRVAGAGLDPWDLEQLVPAGLHLARLLRRTGTGADQLADHAAAERALALLTQDAAPFDPARFAAWRTQHAANEREDHESQPALLRAAKAAQAWMESGIADPPTAAQALLVAHWQLQRRRVLRQIPLPVWAAWPALCAPDDPHTLPHLRSDVASRLAPNGTPWPVVFLHLVAEGARAGSRLLDGLRAAAEAGQPLVKDVNAGSRLPAVLDQLLRQPAVTAPRLAAQLAITPQAALRLLARLQAAGLVREVTGRTRFQGFALS
jgi:hypothetical protein